MDESPSRTWNFKTANIPGLNIPAGKSTPLISPSDRLALSDFVAKPKTAYGSGSARATDAFNNISKAEGGIPKGREMYRALSEYDMDKLKGLKAGDEYTLDSPRSFVGSDDLWRLGDINKTGSTGGGRTNSFATITSKENIPGIKRVNDYLDMNSPVRMDYKTSDGTSHPKTYNTVESEYGSEGSFLPGTRLRINGITTEGEGDDAKTTYDFHAYAPEKPDHNVGQQFK